MATQAGPSRGAKYFILVSTGFIFVLTFMAMLSHIDVDTKIAETVKLRIPTVPVVNNIIQNYKALEPACKDCFKDVIAKSNFTSVFENYEFPVPNCEGKLLVYECAGGLCGGLGDRQKGIMSSFLLALLTDRTFVIDHRKPCDIKKFLEPNLYDWSKCLPHVAKARSKGVRTVHYIDGKGNLPTDFTVLKPGDLWSEHVVTIHVNIRLQLRIKGHPNASQKMPWLMTSSPESVVTGLMHALFKTEDSLEKHLQQFMLDQTGNRRRQFVAVHIRSAFLKVDHDIPIVFKFLEQFSDKEKYSLYIAADKIEIRNQAMKKFDNFASVNRAIVHIDQSNKPCEGVYTAVFEQQILSRADILVMTPSGFSRLAAYIRGSSNDMFFLETKTDLSDTHFEQISLDFLPKRFPVS